MTLPTLRREFDSLDPHIRHIVPTPINKDRRKYKMPRKQKKYHFIYKTICKITGKYYIGMHSSDSLDDGYLGSGKILGYSRHKYGDENHTREILEYCETREQLKFREKEIVNEDLLKDPLNINLKYGGEGGWDHISSISHRPGNTVMQASLTREQRCLRSKKSANTRKNRGYRPNKTKGFTGKKHSKVTILKMKQSHIGLQNGEKNSQFGTIWINDGKINKKIKNTESIFEPWKKGRIIKSMVGVSREPGIS